MQHSQPAPSAFNNRLLLLIAKTSSMLSLSEKLIKDNPPAHIKKIIDRLIVRTKLRMTHNDQKNDIKLFEAEVEIFEKYPQSVIQKKIFYFELELKRLQNDEKKVIELSKKKEKKYKSAVNQIINSAAVTPHFNTQTNNINSLRSKLVIDTSLKKNFYKNLNSFSKYPTIDNLTTLEKSCNDLQTSYKNIIKKRQRYVSAMEAQLRESKQFIYEVLSKIDCELNTKKLFETHNHDKKRELLNLKKKLIAHYTIENKTSTFYSVISEWKNEYEHKTVPSKSLAIFSSKLLAEYGNQLIYPDFRDEAFLAKRYANTLIKKGGTQLENNQLEDDYAQGLPYSVAYIRLISTSSNPYQLRNAVVSHYENSLKAIEKYSLGNCYELALAALDFFLKNTQQRAELYAIEGGDHVFVVVGRRNPSDPYNPKTWGPNALIIDPWSNLVYPALDYKKHLKNYFFKTSSNARRFNFVQDFNPKIHSLVPIPFKNTDLLRTYRNIEILELKERFINKLEDIKKIVADHANRLNKLANKLESRYGKTDSKVMVLREIIISLCTLITRLNIDISTNQEQVDQNTFTQKLNEYQRIISDRLKTLNNTLTFNANTANVLFTVRNKNSFDNKFRLFFGKHGKMEETLQKEGKKTTKLLKNFFMK